MGKTVATTEPEWTMSWAAPAKINLTLAVLGRRGDGYHEIESWVVPVRWCDRLAFREAASLSLTVRGRMEGLPAADSNLVWRAAEALARAAQRNAGAAIDLCKEIPIGAGLGGGSSDAAAALLALNRLWGLNWPFERLLPIAVEIGSDVPLFLGPGAAVIRGRGERVERLTASWRGWIAVVAPRYPVSTAAVYAEWSRRALSNGAAAYSGRRPWVERAMTSQELARRLFNDLEPAAFAVEPRLRRLHELLDKLGDRSVRMTGSGSGLFTVFDNESEAGAWSRMAEARSRGEADVRVVETMQGC